MSVQQFCLRWNNHQPNFVSVFTSLLSNESLVDVTLAAEGKHLQAHRVVLSACSSYFQTLFSVNPCQHPIVILKDVKYNDLKTMVDFMYYGEVNVSQEQLPAILKTAETLKIKGLAEMPEHSMHLSKSLSTSSDKTDAPVPGDSNWSLDTGCRSASPMSPSVRRKRLRKTSTGSGSGSAERTSEEITNEITLISSPIVKPEPAHVSEDGQHSDGSLRNTSQEASTESEPREGSRDSVEDENISVQMTRENSASAVEPAVTDSDLNPLSSQHQHSTSSQGIQWTLMDHGFPRYALSSCQTSLSGQASTFSSPYYSSDTSESSALRRDTSQYSSLQQMVPMSPSCAIANNYGASSVPGSPDQSSCASRCSTPGIMSVSAGSVSGGQNHQSRRKRNPQADENFLRALEAVRLGGVGFCKAARMYGVNNRTLWLEYKKRGYPVTRPSLKSRGKSESASFSSTQTDNGGNMGPPHEMCLPPASGMINDFVDARHADFGDNQNIMPSRHRYPETMSQNLNSPPPQNLHASSPNSKPSKRGRQLMRQSRIKKEMDASHTSPESEPSSPQFIASSSSLLTVPPFRIERQHSEPPPSTSPPPSSSNNLLTVPPTFLVKQMSHPLLPSQQPSSSQGTTLLMHRQSSQPAPQPLQIHLVASASQASTQETPSCASSPGIMMEQLPVLHVFPDNSDTNKSTLRPTLRVRSEELTTHTSSAQALSMRESLEPLRSVHCPVLRPGPALGCNFCWNTIDGHGRILRRKTKYHCPECQTNLCIVPCFQEYHERQTITESKDHSGTTSPTVMKMLPKTSSI